MTYLLLVVYKNVFEHVHSRGIHNQIFLRVNLLLRLYQKNHFQYFVDNRIDKEEKDADL